MCPARVLQSYSWVDKFDWITNQTSLSPQGECEARRGRGMSGRLAKAKWRSLCLHGQSVVCSGKETGSSAGSPMCSRVILHTASRRWWRKCSGSSRFYSPMVKSGMPESCVPTASQWLQILVMRAISLGSSQVTSGRMDQSHPDATPGRGATTTRGHPEGVPGSTRASRRRGWASCKTKVAYRRGIVVGQHIFQ